VPNAIPRPVRLNNPGDLERDGDNWQGMAPDQPDPRFVKFKTPQYGFRALARTLMTYQSRYGLNTVGKIIARWAPPSDNNPTAAYAAMVAHECGVGVDDEIDVDSVAVMLPMCRAIAREESGLPAPWPDSVILEGVHMAGVVDAPPKPLAKQGSFVTKAAGTGGVGIAACLEACKGLINDPSKVHDLSNQVKDAAGQFDAFSGVAVFDHLKTALLTVGGGLLVLSLGLSVMKQRAS
jgi:hypothetical protein